MPCRRSWRGILAVVFVSFGSLALAHVASAARTVYFADHEADAIAQFSVGAGGSLTPLDPAAAPADEPYRLAMTPDGAHLYATADDGVLQYDVDAGDGRLTAQDPALEPAGGRPHSIAIHPSGSSAYVSDVRHGSIRQYDIDAEGRLTPKAPSHVGAGFAAKGVAVSPDGRSAYALTVGGIVVYDVGAGQTLQRRQKLGVPSYGLQDVALTPDGRHLFATSADGRVFQFVVDDDGTPVAKDPPAVALVDGERAYGIAVAPNGSTVAVTSRRWSGPGPRLHAFAVGSEDGLLVPATSPSLAFPTSRLSYLAASPDGKSLFVAGGDGFLVDLAPSGVVGFKDPAEVDLDRAVGVVVSPNQAPTARFAVAPAVAGQLVQFDARGSTDTDGAIVRYDWDFGDGSELADGGPTPVHTYTTAGTFLVKLVVTDDEGASTTTIFTGATALGSGSPGAEASQVVEVAAPAPAPLPPPPAPPAATAQAPQAELGQTMVAAPEAGTIRVRLPNTTRFQRLESLRELPMGSWIDARRGRVELTTVRNRRNRLQQATFYGGLFKVHQRARDGYVTELRLTGRLASCRQGRAGAAAGNKTRRLWGDGRGRHRTRGRYSSASVRGTRWLVEDRCDRTLTVVRRGVVAVRDFVRDRTVVLERGERYLARRIG
jgi:DNA-binding beta-propeller fold protein YncE